MSPVMILFYILLSLLILFGGALVCWMLLRVIARNLWQKELPPLPRIEFQWEKKKSILAVRLRLKKFSEAGIAEIEQLLKDEAVFGDQKEDDQE